jgi:(p)ppGpp synthase/HD superfamily hydrolase
MSGYSDRINHALAFAAKHQDRMVRQGLRPPYSTRAANLAVILARYGRDETSLVAAILTDVLADLVGQARGEDYQLQRISEKFGERALVLARSALPRTHDDDGVELSQRERRHDFLGRLASLERDALWIVAAAALHDAGTLASELARTLDPEAVWQRYKGRATVLEWFENLLAAFSRAGFAEPVVSDLEQVVASLLKAPVAP